MYHNTFRVAELILDKLQDRLDTPKMKRSEKEQMIEMVIRQTGSISCKSDGKQMEAEYHSSTLAMCVYMIVLAEGIAEEIHLKDFELLNILGDVGRILHRGTLE